MKKKWTEGPKSQKSKRLKSEHKNVPFLKPNVRFSDIYCTSFAFLSQNFRLINRGSQILLSTMKININVLFLSFFHFQGKQVALINIYCDFLVQKKKYVEL